MNKKILVFALLVFTAASLFAQTDPESYVSDYLKGIGSCKSLTVTKNSGTVALYGTNGYVFTGFISADLVEVIKKMNKAGQRIDDVIITEGGLWCVLGQRITFGPGLPAGLKACVNSYVSQGNSILCIAFNDLGDWCVVSSAGWECSNAAVTKMLKSSEKSRGALQYVYLGEDRSVMAVCQNGIAYSGSVPQEMLSELSEFAGVPSKAKIFYDSQWFVCSADGFYSAKY